MRLEEIIQENYPESGFFDFTPILNEDESGWTVYQSSNFKKGWKKHKNDKRVSSALYDLIDQLKNGTHPKDLPPQYNAHRLKKVDPNWSGYWDAHLKGQKIILIFDWDPDNKTIKLAHLGTHQEAKITKGS